MRQGGSYEPYKPTISLESPTPVTYVEQLPGPDKLLLITGAGNIEQTNTLVSGREML